MPGPDPHQVTAVVPVKLLTFAKSRLALPSEQRRALAITFAVDTIAALAESPRMASVLVVTSDRMVAGRLRRLAVQVVADEGAGLGPAVRCGIRAATANRPGVGVAVVPADLPCLRAEDVTQVVAAGLTTEGAFVPDRSTTGTTFLIFPPGRPAVARYGPDSAARHRSLGLKPLYDAPVRARHDIDTLDDLRLAVPLGLGPATAAVFAAEF